VVFELLAAGAPDPVFALELLAYGERHPAPGTRSVYERARERLLTGAIPASRWGSLPQPIAESLGMPDGQLSAGAAVAVCTL